MPLHVSGDGNKRDPERESWPCSLMLPIQSISGSRLLLSSGILNTLAKCQREVWGVSRNSQNLAYIIYEWLLMGLSLSLSSRGKFLWRGNEVSGRRLDISESSLEGLSNKDHAE